MDHQGLSRTAGASSGYGAGIAKAFAAQGAKVVIADINQPAEGVLNQAPGSLKFHKTDVSKQDNWQSLVQATKDAFGRIDCLVNNAGTTHRNQVRNHWRQAPGDRN